MQALKLNIGSLSLDSRTLLKVVLLTLAALPALDGSYLLAKAHLAQRLIERSWNTEAKHPWPWADTAPVAKLQIPALGLDSYVLDGATGATLAFGPGMVSGSAQPGSTGITMIAAHRDTHFESLQHIATGDIIKIQDPNKQWFHYRVTAIRIADSRTETVRSTVFEPLLLLVTCYPFDALIPGGPLRYVVEAEQIKNNS